jgi:CheY-like chemotaxis protein
MVSGHILLVDDEQLVRLSTAEMLKELGYTVVEVSSAEEAISRIRSGLSPKFVVTDHLMAGVTGAELARTLTASEPPIPVLIISGYADVDGIPAEFATLTKPFRKDELGASLNLLRS